MSSWSHQSTPAKIFIGTNLAVCNLWYHWSMNCTVHFNKARVRHVKIISTRRATTSNVTKVFFCHNHIQRFSITYGSANCTSHGNIFISKYYHQNTVSSLRSYWGLCIHSHTGNRSLICQQNRIYSHIHYISLSHPSILGVTLCFCTSSYTAAAAGRRFLFTR